MREAANRLLGAANLVDIDFRMLGLAMDSETTIFAGRKISADLFSKRILLVDDVDLICRVVSKQMMSAGFHEVQYQSDSRLAISSVQAFKPNMILLDIFMPNISGLEILKQIRSSSEYDNIIVLMLSSAGADEHYQSLELGALGFIQKPISAVNLVQAITSKFNVARRLGIQ